MKCQFDTEGQRADRMWGLVTHVALNSVSFQTLLPGQHKFTCCVCV